MQHAADTTRARKIAAEAVDKQAEELFSAGERPEVAEQQLARLEKSLSDGVAPAGRNAHDVLDSTRLKTA